jgi:hypothetical protein
MKRPARATKRGRPPKFGRPGQVVAITLPAEVVRGLRRINPDLAWAIVQLFERGAKRLVGGGPPERPDSELVSVANGRSLIVVNRDVLKQLPGVHLIPLHDDRAFLALDRDATMADLELAIVERLAVRSVGTRERKALTELRAHVQRWRHDRKLHCEMRSIIVLEKAGAGRRRSRSTAA